MGQLRYLTLEVLNLSVQGKPSPTEVRGRGYALDRRHAAIGLFGELAPVISARTF